MLILKAPAFCQIFDINDCSVNPLRDFVEIEARRKEDNEANNSMSQESQARLELLRLTAGLSSLNLPVTAEFDI